MDDVDPMRDAMAKVLTENGISEGADELHGLRCVYPDIYGPCTHVAELLDDLAAALAPLIEERVREAQAEAWADGFAAATDAVPEDVWFGPWSRTRNPYRDEESNA